MKKLISINPNNESVIKEYNQFNISEVEEILEKDN